MVTSKALGASIFMVSALLSVYLAPESITKNVVSQIYRMEDPKNASKDISMDVLAIDELLALDPTPEILTKRVTTVEGELHQKQKEIDSLKQKLGDSKLDIDEQLAVVIRRADKLKDENSRLMEAMKRGSKDPIFFNAPTPLWQYAVNCLAVILLGYVFFLKFSEYKKKQAITSVKPSDAGNQELSTTLEIERMRQNDVRSARPQIFSDTEHAPEIPDVAVTTALSAGQFEETPERSVDNEQEIQEDQASSLEPAQAPTQAPTQGVDTGAVTQEIPKEESSTDPSTPTKVAVLFEEYPPDPEPFDMSGNVIDELLEEPNPLEQSFIELPRTGNPVQD